jgi:hypothetical protein
MLGDLAVGSSGEWKGVRVSLRHLQDAPVAAEPSDNEERRWTIG